MNRKKGRIFSTLKSFEALFSCCWYVEKAFTEREKWVCLREFVTPYQTPDPKYCLARKCIRITFHTRFSLHSTVNMIHFRRKLYFDGNIWKVVNLDFSAKIEFCSGKMSQTFEVCIGKKLVCCKGKFRQNSILDQN